MIALQRADRDTRQLIRDIKANPKKPWDFCDERFDVSEGTVKDAAEKEGVPQAGETTQAFISERNQGKRVEWVRDNVGQHWGFTDESSIAMGVRQQWTIRRAREKYDPEYVQTTFHSQMKILMRWGPSSVGNGDFVASSFDAVIDQRKSEEEG